MLKPKCYTLKNKNHAILDFLYESGIHLITDILKVYDIRYAPPAILDANGNVTRARLNSWWTSRSIPRSRTHFHCLMSELNIQNPLILTEKCLGLSLSDRYWIDDSSHPHNWEAVNFFDNNFSEELGFLTLEQNVLCNNPNFMSPNSTLNGNLRKKWTTINDKRILIKSGSDFISQEVYNEVIATCLHRRLLESDDFVPYSIYHENNRSYCSCPNMLDKDEEFIPALHIIQRFQRTDTQNDYQFLVSCFENLGLHNVEPFLSKMFACDYLIGNFDRHYRNFGVIRNVETLKYTRIAPIFDTGSSLWCNVQFLDTYTDYKYIVKPFRCHSQSIQQLPFFSHFEWFTPEKLNGFTDEVRELLRSNPNMPQARIDQILIGIEHQISYVINHM